MIAQRDIRLDEACRLLGGICRTTFVTWATEGDCHGKKLDAWKRGRLWFTSLAAIEAFKTRPTEAQQITKSGNRQRLKEKYGIG